MELGKARFWLTMILSSLLVTAIVFGALYNSYVGARSSSAEYLLSLMYDFDSMDDLCEQYKVVWSMVDEESWSKLDIENDNRVINAYYKFKDKPSRVQIVERGDDYIVYRLSSESIDPNRHFVLFYEEQDGKLVNIREYVLRWVVDKNGGGF